MIDKVELMVRAGNGGDGAISFRREKFVPRGGPDGGDGGTGGAVVARADPSASTLLEFRGRRLLRAANGESGKGKKRHGKRAADLVLKVPVGTVIWDKEKTGDEALIADLKQSGQQVVLARGGKGGWGNIHFVSPTNQAPRLAQKGEVGEEKRVVLEMRLIADVGIIGYPNVGKSTLLATASAARPKVADYPFTTLEPILGVVSVEEESFVLAEIPGLIEDAHMGRGLGSDFLRHTMRTRVLIHLIDGTSASPVEDMMRVNKELSLFDSALSQRPQIVAVNKIDLPEVQSRLDDIKDAFKEAGVPVDFVSAATGKGVPELMAGAMKLLREVSERAGTAEKASQKVFRPRPEKAAGVVRKEGETYVIASPDLGRVVARVDMTDPEVSQQFRQHLSRTGVSRALEKAGVKPGSKVKCGDFEWEW